MSSDGIDDPIDKVLTGRMARSDFEQKVQYYQFSAGICGLLGGLGFAQGARGLGDPSASTAATLALLVLGALALVAMYVCMLRRSANARKLGEATRALLIAERAEETTESLESTTPQASAYPLVLIARSSSRPAASVRPSPGRLSRRVRVGASFRRFRRK